MAVLRSCSPFRGAGRCEGWQAADPFPRSPKTQAEVANEAVGRGSPRHGRWRVAFCSYASNLPVSCQKDQPLLPATAVRVPKAKFIVGSQSTRERLQSERN